MENLLGKLAVCPISPKPTPTYTVTLSEATLRDIIFQTLHHASITSVKVATNVNTCVDSILKTLRSENARQNGVYFDSTTDIYATRDLSSHCEASLLHFHYLNPDISSYLYVGASKRCCQLCFSLFQAYNRSVMSSQRYLVKRTNRKILPTSPLPPFEGAIIRAKLIEELQGALAQSSLRANALHVSPSPWIMVCACPMSIHVI